MFNFFKNKHQEQIIKQISVPDVTKSVSQLLKLSTLHIEFNVSMRKPYRAFIKYEERPEEWSNHGVTDYIEIFADSWSDLLDKVAEHFHEHI